jgi:malonyl-CoA/methylmalonyl-CoA synthetase
VDERTLETATDRFAASLPLLQSIQSGGEQVAITDPFGEWSYGQVATGSAMLAGALLRDAGTADLRDVRVGLMCRPGFDFAVGLLACFRAGAIAVPLQPDHPISELDYAVSDAGITRVIVSSECSSLAEALASRHRGLSILDATERCRKDVVLPSVRGDWRAMMVYTSGTTGNPKGVVHTHESLSRQVATLVAAWRWSKDDRTVLVLPLHHVHGIVNVVLCSLCAGATCEAPGRFDASHVWKRLASGEVSVFMAVPTIYKRLIARWEEMTPTQKRACTAGALRVRLMVSGSAALPVSTLERWREITGHVLLERYGMTETGMVLSNSLDGRVPGHVGEPLPGVEVRIIDECGRDAPDGQSGELLVRSAQVFAEYWKRPEATANSFSRDWFRTGDVVIREPDGFRILGRSSIDIIKTGGEKVSALEVEEKFRVHPEIVDLAVVGIPDADWGERVCAAVVPRAGATQRDVELRAWGKERLAGYKVPVEFAFVDELPRNAVGKVVKPAVKAMFAALSP